MLKDEMFDSIFSYSHAIVLQQEYIVNYISVLHTVYLWNSLRLQVKVCLSAVPTISHFNPVSGILTFNNSVVVKKSCHTIYSSCPFMNNKLTLWGEKCDNLSENKKPCLCHDSVLALSLFNKTQNSSHY